MASDVAKHLERARRSLEKNKLREAIGEYQAVLDESPSHQEAVQALADLYTRLSEPHKAAQYYGLQFDRLVESGDALKAAAIFTRFLRQSSQPPDRLMRYAMLLQKQNRLGEAIEQFNSAAGLFQEQQREVEALACYESVALLDPENPAPHVVLADFASKLGHVDLATRSYIRAGQLILASGALDAAAEYFRRAHELSPLDRTAALLYAETQLRSGNAEATVRLLEPFSPNEKDTAFLATFGEALLQTGRLDRAREVLEAYYKQQPDSFAKLFELAGAYIEAGEGEKAVSTLAKAKEWMKSTRKELELCAQLDRMAAAHPDSLALAEAVAKTYEELNRETKYFEALMRLFDLYLGAGRIPEACEILDRLVDIDPYDYRNHERIALLEGKADRAFLENIHARAAKAASTPTGTGSFSGAGSDNGARAPVSEAQRAQQALEDLMVQVEIFLQYSLQPKAIERLERIAELFPGEEARNERLRTLYERANWWPKGVPAVPAGSPTPSPAPLAVDVMPAPAIDIVPTPVPSAAETNSDLAAIAEINRLMYRQATPREVLSTTAAEIGKRLEVVRCMAIVGSLKDGNHTTAEYASPKMRAASAGEMAAIAGFISKATPDELGGVELNPSTLPALKDLGIKSALGVVLTDKEGQSTSGVLVIADANVRKWKANESFFLQAVGDQLLMSVNHMRLRSLVRSLAVADEKTGVLGRGAYIDCLLAESNRARTQGTPLSLIILHVDRGSEILRQHGDAAVDQYVEQLTRAVSPSVRQTDIIVKYTAWSLAFVLPGTSLENAQELAEKLRRVAASVRPSWASADLAVSVVTAESTSRPADQTEDRVTEWMNRAEAGLDEARRRGGNALVALATP
ncbi:MAG TPA: tetratricopeptide repeat protein [Candidatus Cybelea sp.]|nr:tetratricopeptide repeat protein [Candidatus Cybelea sp.]